MRKLIAVLVVLVLAATMAFAGGSTEAEAKHRIGIVFDIGGKGDKSFNDSAYNGLAMLAKDYKGYIADDPDKVDFGKEIKLKYLEPQAGGQDREQLLRAMAEEGYELIFGVGFLFTDSISKVAADFPDTHFALIDGYIPDLGSDSNITCLAFAEHEGSFLVGALVGLMAGDAPIGFLGGMDIPLIHKFQGGFYAGAMYTNPALRDEKKLLGQYAGKDPGAFNDPKTGESIAQSMYKQGANIIYHASGGTGNGLFKAARDMDKIAIGVDSDQGLIYMSSQSAEEKDIGKHILTSMLKRVDSAVYLTAKQFMDEGGVPGGYRTFSLSDDGVGYAANEFNSSQLAPYTKQLEDIKAKIISGEITVPDDDAKVRDWAMKTFKDTRIPKAESSKDRGSAFFCKGFLLALLEMEKITKIFPGVVANDQVSFDLEAGEIHALVGENGAGKTTLMKILYGLYRPEAGTIRVNNQAIQIRGPRDAIQRGIGMVHQHFMLVPPFTALENIVLGEETHTAGILTMAKPHHRIEELMKANGLTLDIDTPVDNLPVGLQQRVEILKVLYRGAEILVFDEPTAVLTPQETQELFATFQEMKAQGKGLVFISHKLDEVLEIADRITVIRRGKVIKTLPKGQANKPLIAELMVGKPVLLNVEKPPGSPQEKVLQIKRLTIRSEQGTTELDDVSLNVRAGEIFGIAGVEGNGQTPLIRAVADRVSIESGDILLGGQSLLEWDVRKRREAGVTHVPEDRHRFGLLLPFSVADNGALGRHHRPPFVGRFQWIDSKAIGAYTADIVKRFDVRTPSVATPANTLSGGNQQKLILAREISAAPKLLLAAQPTRGVDVGAQEFIYRQLIQARQEGCAVLLVSADLDEIMELSDRIGVLFKGKIIREFDRQETTKEEVGFYMMGERE